MDIFEWVFKERPWEKQLTQVESLKASIQPQIELFHNLWRAHQRKLSVLTDINEKGKTELLKEIPTLNDAILTYFEEILYKGGNIRVLIKKILYESSERLQEIDVLIWRYRDEPPTWDKETGQVIKPRVEITPYNIEASKKAVWELVKNLAQDEEALAGFVNRVLVEIQPEVNQIIEQYKRLKKVLDWQSAQAKQGIWAGFGSPKNYNVWRFEDNIIKELKKVLTKVVNKTIVIARLESKIKIEEQKTKEEFIKEAEQKTRKEVGVMLIHQITGSPYNMLEFEDSLKSRGYITYNVRLPGHATSLEEFFNTPVEEIERFLISNFNYFYQAMKKMNNGDGRFYIAGNSLGAMMPLHIMAKSWQVVVKTDSTAKRFNKKIGETVTIYPYQDIIKGLISIAAATSLAVGSFGVGPPIVNVGPKAVKNPIAYKIATFILASIWGKKKGEEGMVQWLGIIDKKIEEIKQRIDPDIEPDKFYEAIRKEIRTLIPKMYRKKITKINNLKLKNMINEKIEEIKQRINQNRYPDKFNETTKKEIQVIRETFRGMPTEMNEDDLNNMIELIMDNVKEGRMAFAGQSLMDIKPLKESKGGHSAKTALRDLVELGLKLREDVKHIYRPILILQGIHDIVAHPSSADYIYNNVKTNPKFKKKVMLESSGHTPQIDFDKEIVFEESVKFIEMVEKSEKVPVYG